MSGAGSLGWLVEALGASALLMAFVLAVRRPVRHAFGARVAYALWALPALRLVLPPLPQGWRSGAAMPVSDVVQGLGVAGMTTPPVTVLTYGAATAGAPQAAASALPWGVLLLGLWAAGAFVLLAWQVIDYARFRARVMRDASPLSRIGRVRVVESRGAAGPLAFGIVDRVVAFPRDFAERYDVGERDLALAHELGHHARGDLIANWVALTVLALHWWNPLAWVAFRAFRTDQEMANDAGVLARVGAAARHAYGCAIVKAAHGRAVTATCHLHSVRDLKGRLKMLNQHKASSWRLLAGTATTAALTLGALFATASGSAAAERVKQTVATSTGVDLSALEAVAAFQAEPAPLPPLPGNGSVTRKRVIVTEGGKTQTYEGAEADAYLAANPVPPPPAPPATTGAVAPPLPPLPPLPGATSDKQVRVYTLRKDASDPAAQSGVWNGKMPPMPPMQISSRDCQVGPDGPESQTVLNGTKGRTRVTVICTNRIQTMAQRASADAERTTQASMNAAEISRNALVGALTTLRSTRESLAANPNLTGTGRTDALKEIDDAIREVEEEAKSGA